MSIYEINAFKSSKDFCGSYLEMGNIKYNKEFGKKNQLASL